LVMVKVGVNFKDSFCKCPFFNLIREMAAETWKVIDQKDEYSINSPSF
jgi:hypothetical protein